MSPEWPYTLLVLLIEKNNSLFVMIMYADGSDMEGQCSAGLQNWQSSSNMEFCWFLPVFCC